MAVTAHDDDGEFTNIPSKGSNNSSRQQRNRIYIGNLPALHQTELQEIVATRLDLPTSSVTVVNHQPPQNSATIAITGINVEAAISSLHGLQPGGKKLVIHRDNTRGSSTVKSTHGAQPLFGSWTKPKKVQSKENNGETLLLNTCEALPSSNNGTKSMQDVTASNPNSDDGVENCDSTTTPDFSALRQNPLSKLLEEYGEEDPDWMNQEPIDDKIGPAIAITTSTNPTASVVPLETTNRLQRHGMAPIHVEFVSFGYRHGIPCEVRENATGHSHRQPLVAFDSRTSLEEVPHYLAWMDGLSGAVKNSMIRHRPNSGVGRGNGGGKHNFHSKGRRSDLDAPTAQTSSASIEQNDTKASSTSHCTFLNVRDYARDVVAVPVADAVEAAMTLHGYADPLNMTVYIGSELGRHRSVVAAEQAATALRKLLRENAGNRFSCTVSVGCRHRDVDRKNHKVSASKTPVTARVTKNRMGGQVDEDE